MNKPQLYAMFAGASLLLGACGGGSDDSPPPPDPLSAVPASANQSADGMVAYLSVLGGLQSDTREPFDVASFDPPKPDDTEPKPVE
jgi:hypothetical protein